MQLSSLKAPRPLPPKLSVVDKRVQTILRDLETIKYSKPSKQLKKCENLTYFIVQSLRRANSDHLLHTTAIFALINVFRLFPEPSKEFMLSIGVAAILHDILVSDLLSGSTRQYASELCFYLSTNQPYPNEKDVPTVGPLKELPEVAAINKYSDTLDSISISSDLSSVENERGGAKHTFVPYRINDQNMIKLEALFTNGYEHELAASLPNPLFMSEYGFSDARRKRNRHLEDDDSEDEDDQEGTSVNSSISSRSRSVQGSYTHTSVSERLSVSPTRQNSFGNAVSAAQQQALRQKVLGSMSFDFSPTSRTYVSHQGDDAGSAYLSFSPPRSSAHQHILQQQQREPGIAYTPPDYRSKNASSHFNMSNNFRIGRQLRSTDSSVTGAITSENSHNFYPETLASGSMTFLDARPTTTAGGRLADASMLTNNLSDCVEPQWSSASDMQFYAKIPSRHDAPLTGGFVAGMGSKLLGRAATTGSGTRRAVAQDDMAEFMMQLDPLTLSVSKGLRAHHRFSTGDSLASNANSDDDESALFSDEEEGNVFDANESTFTERSESNVNQFVIRKRTRIRAEKLVDHQFTRSLFVRKAKMADTQSLIARMESMLQLLDKENTGFVPWESFARVVIAVAPPHLLRADVLAFMDAQTDDVRNLIDYNEFLISGKVMVIEGQQVSKDVLPIGGWLARQRSIAGDDSTYTWKNHVKWYQQRKARAVIWLIRRAARSLKQATRLEDATNFLLKQRARAIAVTYLLEVAHMALSAQEKRVIAKRNLILRCMHARKWVRTVGEAQKWLSSQASSTLVEMQCENDVSNMKRQFRFEEAQRLEAMAKKQANYGNLFKVAQLTAIAVKFLRKQAALALKYCAQQDHALDFLRRYAEKVQMQLTAKQEARNWLLACADRSYRYCIQQDNTLLSLLRLGANAHKFKARQEDTLNWLRLRGARAVGFLDRKDDVMSYMAGLGSHTLQLLNERETAFQRLRQRTQQAEKLLVRRREAVAFLQQKPVGVWKVEMDVQKAQLWLATKAKKAHLLQINKHKAFQKLQFIASRATLVQRRNNLAHADLVQIGQQARLQHFHHLTRDIPIFISRLKEARWHQEKADSRHHSGVDTLSLQQRWRFELSEAFDWLAMLYSPPELHPPKKKLLGRLGFRRLVIEGKLLGLNPDSLDEHFKAVDPGTACFVYFEAVWPWFLHVAERRNKAMLAKNSSRPFRFSSTDIMSNDERALVSVMRRVNSERDSEEDLLHYDRALYSQSTRRSKRKGLLDDSDGEDSGEEEVEEEENDFDDLAYLQSGGADIGKLMRYLTRKSEPAVTASAASDMNKAVIVDQFHNSLDT